MLTLVKDQLGRHKITHYAGLGFGEVRRLGLVDLGVVGEKQQLGPIGSLRLQGHGVALLELLDATHPKGLGGNLLEIALGGDEKVHRVVRDLLRFFLLAQLVGVDEQGLPGLAVLFGHLPELVDDDLADLPGAAQDVLHLGDGVFQVLGLLEAVQDVLAV